MSPYFLFFFGFFASLRRELFPFAIVIDATGNLYIVTYAKRERRHKAGDFLYAAGVAAGSTGATTGASTGAVGFVSSVMV